MKIKVPFFCVRQYATKHKWGDYNHCKTPLPVASSKRITPRWKNNKHQGPLCPSPLNPTKLTWIQKCLWSQGDLYVLINPCVVRKIGSSTLILCQRIYSTQSRKKERKKSKEKDFSILWIEWTRVSLGSVNSMECIDPRTWLYLGTYFYSAKLKIWQ